MGLIKGGCTGSLYRLWLALRFISRVLKKSRTAVWRISHMNLYVNRV